MGKHTLETLTEDLANFKRSVNSRLTKQGGILKDMQPKVNAMHDFMTDAKGFERGQADKNKDGTINISKDVWGLIMKLVVIIGVLVGIKMASS